MTHLRVYVELWSSSTRGLTAFRKSFKTWSLIVSGSYPLSVRHQGQFRGMPSFPQYNVSTQYTQFTSDNRFAAPCKGERVRWQMIAVSCCTSISNLAIIFACFFWVFMMSLILTSLWCHPTHSDCWPAWFNSFLNQLLNVTFKFHFKDLVVDVQFSICLAQLKAWML